MGIFSKKKTNASPVKFQASNAILDAIRDGIIIISQSGNIEYLNPASATFANFDQSEAIGLKYDSVVHLVDQDGSPVQNGQDPIATAIAKNQPIDSQCLYLAKTDAKGYIPVCLTVAPIDAGPATNYVVILRNIAKELKGEQERNEFISTASHEMRSPVASIEGYLGLALNPQTATLDPRARAYLEKAHESSQHLGQLFRDLLDTSNLSDNRIKLHPVPVEITTFVKSLADGMAPIIVAKGLRYSFGQSDPELAPVASSVQLSQVIYCSLDINYLREIVDNVINNAIKYTSSGSITVSVVGDKNEAVIIVADTGMGISEAHQDHIFQKFYRVDNSQTRNTDGTGLGLFIVKQRTEAMGGRVWVRSEEGQGSKFFIAFPRISTEEYQRQKLAATSTMAPQNNPNVASTPMTPVQNV